MKVGEHTTKEASDKPDKFTIKMDTPEATFSIGRDNEATASLTIKTTDEMSKQDFPMEHEFAIEIYDLTSSRKIEMEKTEQQRLPKGEKSEDEKESPTEPQGLGADGDGAGADE